MEEKDTQVIQEDIIESDLSSTQKFVLGIGIFTVLTLIFYLAPINLGFDWTVIIQGSQRLLRGEEVYQKIDLEYGYYYAPWLTTLLAPISVLPNRLTFAMLNAITLLGTVILSFRFKLGLIRTLLLLTSPPIFYSLMLGQIDIMVLLFIFLPKELWAIAALTKPQTTLGLGFALLNHPRRWIRTIIVSVSILAVSFLIFGNWIMKILAQQATEQNAFAGHNIFGGLWPFQLVVGLGLLSLAFGRKDERIYIAASPFLMPYASTSSFIGTLLATFSMIRHWQATIIWLAWWGAIVYRGLSI